MSKTWDNTNTELPHQISTEASRERLQRMSTITTMHPWFGRQPTVNTRIATYLALTGEASDSDTEFILGLGSSNPSESIINEARMRVRDTAWLWKLQELLSSTETEADISFPDLPKILDPFSGGGSIPLEASRLGCESYAGDLNPVAYLLLRAGLEFPIAFNSPDSSVNGSASDGKWSGLVEELTYWAKEVDNAVSGKVQDLFPSVNDNQPSHYIWVYNIQCSNSECGVIYPISKIIPISNRPRLTLTYNWTSQKPILYLTDNFYTREDRISFQCPECGHSADRNKIQLQCVHPSLIGIIQSRSFVLVQPETVSKLYPWLPKHQQRLEELLNEPFADGLQQILPEETFCHLKKRFDYQTFKDLFSSRQLLVALEYIAHIREVIHQMKSKEIPIERIHAIATYLAFFISFLVERNNKLCSWNANSSRSIPIFNAISPQVPSAYTETPPFKMMEIWLKKIIPAIHTATTYPRKGTVYHGDAAHLSFENNYFDAIITNPPYCNCIQYSEIFDFLWVWENMIISIFKSSYGLVNVSKDAYVESPRNNDTSAYHQKLFKVNEELYRVLKPGHRLCLFLTISTKKEVEEQISPESLDYISVCQEAGFELSNIRRITDGHLD